MMDYNIAGVQRRGVSRSVRVCDLVVPVLLVPRHLAGDGVPDLLPYIMIITTNLLQQDCYNFTLY